MLILQNAVVLKRAHSSRVWRVTFIYNDLQVSMGISTQTFKWPMVVRTIGSCATGIYQTKTLV